MCVCIHIYIYVYLFIVCIIEELILVCSFVSLVVSFGFPHNLNAYFGATNALERLTAMQLWPIAWWEYGVSHQHLLKKTYVY